MDTQIEKTGKIKEKLASEINAIWRENELSIRERFDKSMAAARLAVQDAGLGSPAREELEAQLIVNIADEARDACTDEINRIWDRGDLAQQWKFDEARQVILEIGLCDFPREMRAILMAQLEIVEFHIWFSREYHIKELREQAQKISIEAYPSMYA